MLIMQQLEEMQDPLRKEVANVRKRIDMANRELKPLGQSCQKKVKQYLQIKLTNLRLYDNNPYFESIPEIYVYIL